MRLKSAVALAAIKAAYTELGLTAAPTTDATTGIATTNRIQFGVSTLNRILMQLEQGEFILFASFFDTFYVKDSAAPLDEVVLSFFKSLTDDAAVADEALVVFNRALAETAGATDEITRLEVIKGFLDTSVVQESHSLGFARPLDDAYSASEQISLGTGRAVSDAAATTDQVNTIGFGKVPSDGVNFADSTTDVISFGFDINLPKMPGPYFAEDYVASDYTTQEGFAFARDLPSMEPGKALSDTSTFADLFTRQVAYARAFNDPVNATDDVDGSASILDDQEMQYVKFLTETSNITDDFARQVNYIREFANAGSAADTFDKVVAYVRTFSGADNTASTTDANHLAITKNEADAAHLADLRFSVVSKARSDTASTTDEGLILTQSYAGFYFSEDFVGSSTTF